MNNKKSDKENPIIGDEIFSGNKIEEKYDYMKYDYVKYDFLPIKRISERDYKRFKNKLQEIERKRKIKLIYPIIILFCTAIAIVVYFLETSYRSIRIYEVILYALTGLCSGCIISIYVFLIFDMLESSVRRKIYEYEVDNIQGEVKEDIFENSIKMSYKYLDQYYLQTREQAQRGFFVTVCIVVGGAILISVGITAMFLNKTTPSIITCASGIIIEFIASIFFYLYNKTVTSMSSYHNKLVLSQNISIALKVADSLSEEEQNKTKALIISELIRNINSHLTEEEVKNRNKKDRY